MKFKSKQFFLTLLLIVGGIFLLFHNISQYPTDIGYIFGLNARYAKILTSEWRFPSLSETVEAYNPPFFYLISGLFAQLISKLTNKSFIDSIKFWPYLSTSLAVIALYLWLQIINKLNPKNKLLGPFWLIWLFSIPVFQKMMPMYTSEPYLLFMVALIFWYFIIIFQPKPTIKKIIILSILVSIILISRITPIILIPVIFLGIFGMALIKQLTLGKALKISITFITIVTIIVTPFYYANIKRNKKITSPARAKKGKTTLSKYGLSFYTDIPFKYMMTYPFRRDVRENFPLNKLIPVYYSTFWGDYWNYFIQSKFNIDLETRRNNRYIVNSDRIASLALQNRINILPTFILIAGFIYQFIQVIKRFPRKLNDKWLIETMLLTFSCLLWFSYLYYLNFHLGWKGDNIKACYMLYALPIFIYMATVFLFKKLKKYKIIFIPTMIWLILATSINLWWAWY